MPEPSRIQIAVYGAIAVALLFVGARAVRGEGGEGGESSGYTSSYDDYGSEEDESGEGGEEESFAVSGEAGDLVVDVTGAVERPGVYRLPAGSRVDDAVKRAGGATGRAEVESLNLAAHLADGQQVVVPEEVAPGAPGAPGASSGVAASADAAGEEGPISLATATAAELDTITGIGPVTAEAIIAFREEHGGLSSVDQLDQISGIGPSTMEALRERLGP